MRYLDTGSRDPQHALGTWLGDELIGTAPVAALRLQTGFFGSDALGYFKEALDALATSNGHTRILIGSNDGQTSRAAVADLLAVAGAPRTGLRMGVVSFQAGYFHPKVFHVERSDGSSTAYVGSANLTGSGAASLHVEAGIVLDSRQGDDQNVLASIATAIDDWFTRHRPGLYEVTSDADLDQLVNANVLGVRVNRTRRTIQLAARGDASASTTGYSLHTLIAVPPLTPAVPTGAAVATAVDSPGGAAAPNLPTPPAAGQTAPAPTPGTIVERWGKTLSQSDAGRKPGPNSAERGSIPLNQGTLRGQIDQSTWFRTELFGQRVWNTDLTRTGKARETAWVPMHVSIAGTYYGVRRFKITNEPNRLQGERNLPTAQLHVGPITPILKEVDVTSRDLDIALDANGEYWLTIA